MLVSSSRPNVKQRRRCPNTSLTLGAHIVWGGRILLFEKMAAIKKEFPTSQVYMANTDSVVVSVPKGADLTKLDIHKTRNGAFKNQISECKHILKFFAISPVCYSFYYKSHSNEFKELMKAAGFKLNTLISQKFTLDKFESLVESIILNKEQKASIEIKQLKDNKTVLYHMRNNLDKSRIIYEDFTSKPFGFTNQE